MGSFTWDDSYAYKAERSRVTAVVDCRLRATITRWVDDHFPGFVEIRFEDRFGRVWVFVDKVPVVTTKMLDAQSVYPQPVLIDCTVLSWGRDELQRRTAEIKLVWIESLDGVSVFQVFADQLVEVLPSST